MLWINYVTAASLIFSEAKFITESFPTREWQSLGKSLLFCLKSCPQTANILIQCGWNNILFFWAREKPRLLLCSKADLLCLQCRPILWEQVQASHSPGSIGCIGTTRRRWKHGSWYWVMSVGRVHLRTKAWAGR